METRGFAKVIIDLPAQEIDRPFEYAIPADISQQVGIGSMVLVNFGRAPQVGYVVGVSSEPTVDSPKPILDVLDDSFFDKEMIELGSWIADYYLSTLGRALKLALPAGRGRYLSQHVLLNPDSDSEEALETLPPKAKLEKQVLSCIHKKEGKMTLPELKKMFGKDALVALRMLEKRGLVLRKYRISEPRTKTKKEEYVRLALPFDKTRTLADELLKGAPKQRKILDILKNRPEMPLRRLLSLADASRASLESLVDKSLVSAYFRETYRDPDFHYPEEFPEDLTLTDEQIRAVREIKKALRENVFKVFLLQGVTGSGKTEIYIQAIEELLGFGKTAIVLVPEIALTPQTAGRFRHKFGEKVAVLHSGLGAGERFDQWLRIKRGQCRVVVGARSALFAPVTNLGLIVVDEEHETTYKQNKNPRYSATSVALKRAEISQCSVILGSATPALESRYKAEDGEYMRLLLKKRICDRELPAIEIVDMREELQQGNRSIFSVTLQNEMQKCLEADNKFILFLNRRGYSSFLLCRDCGFVPKCERCAVSLTYHQDNAILRCHHCGYSAQAPRACPSCAGLHLRHFGVGTQKVESEISKLFPGLLIIRMDADTTTGKDSHRKKLMEFRREKKSVLLGTQMIAKGLDFPEVTLVGVINADTALNLPDFRAAERTFQVLMQVSGRAGRGEQPGKVVVQTYLPDNYAIRSLLAGDYEHFYKQEIPLREELNYPPFCQLINIVVSGKDDEKTESTANRIAELISGADQSSITSLLGPAPAPLARIKDRHRWHIVLKVAEIDQAGNYLRENFRKLGLDGLKEEVAVTIDIDPVWML